MATALPRPRLAIVGEPTRLRIADRHKGIHGFETVITGRDGHSSATHRGVNAISAAAELVLELERIAAGFRRSEEHTSELQSLMRISYAVFCLKKKKKKYNKR